MRKVVKIMPDGIFQSFEVDDNELSQEFIKANIGLSDGTSYFERTNFYGFQGINVVCDEEGKLKKMKPSLNLVHDVIVGDCIIVSCESNKYGEFAWYGLDCRQFEIVLSKLIF